MPTAHCRNRGCKNRVPDENLAYCAPCWRAIPPPIQAKVARAASALRDAIWSANRALARGRAA